MKNAFLEKKSKQKGFTLIEVMITIVIVSIGMLALAGLLITGIKVNADSEARMDVSGVAQSIMSRVSVPAAAAGYLQATAQTEAETILATRWSGNANPSGVLYTPTILLSPATTVAGFTSIIVRLQWNSRGQNHQVELRSGVATN